MERNKDLEINQIIKYINNEMSKEEVSKFEELLLDENNLNKLKKYIVTDHYIQMGKNDFDDQEAFSRFRKQTKPFIKSRKNKIAGILKYAAVFIGILIAGVTVYICQNELNTNQNNTQITLQFDNEDTKVIKDTVLFKEIKNDDGVLLGIQKKNKIVYNDKTASKPGINTLKVPNGKKFQLVLSDGTIINVNAGSTLKFPSYFLPGQVRKVELSGEAYFEVTRNEKDPFIVTTNGIKTEVFGTKFNVSSYSNDSFSEVVLIEGSIGVFKGKERFDHNIDQKLKPQQKASVLNAQKDVRISNVKAENYIAWVNGVLLFKNEDFESIMKKLERFYNKKITINYQKIKTEKFTGQFDIESIEEVLNTFKSNTFFNINKKENEIIINP